MKVILYSLLWASVRLTQCLLQRCDRTHEANAVGKAALLLKADIQRLTKHYDGPVIHCETVPEAIETWNFVYEEQIPCVIRVTGQDEPWAAFPMERLLNE